MSVGKTIVEVSCVGSDYFEEFELVVTKDFVITGIPSTNQYPGYKIVLGIEGEIASDDIFEWYTSDSTIASITKNEIDGIVLTCHKPGEVYIGFTVYGVEGIEVLFNVATPSIKKVTLVNDGSDII